MKEERKYKFRAWIHQDVDDNDNYINHTMVYDLAFSKYAPINELLNTFYSPIMQYIGFEDKNGIEIYEDDILELSHEGLKMKGVVKRAEDGHWIFYKDEDNYLGVHHNLGRITVVGNIHANSELLNP